MILRDFLARLVLEIYELEGVHFVGIDRRDRVTFVEPMGTGPKVIVIVWHDRGDAMITTLPERAIELHTRRDVACIIDAIKSVRIVSTPAAASTVRA